MFFETFEKVCKARGKKISEVIHSAGIPQSTVTYWRQGKLPTLATIYKLADALSVAPAELVPDPKQCTSNK